MEPLKIKIALQSEHITRCITGCVQGMRVWCSAAEPAHRVQMMVNERVNPTARKNEGLYQEFMTFSTSNSARVLAAVPSGVLPPMGL